MEWRHRISGDEVRDASVQLGLDWTQVNLAQFRRSPEVELDYGSRNPETNVTNDDRVLTCRIILAHLEEFLDYYGRVGRLEGETADEASAYAYWGE